jgi:proline-specific peptidase
MTESFRAQDGRTLTYRREGSGPILVCHPGGPGFSSRYLSDLAGLGDTFTLVFLDPRGTGASTTPADDRAYTTADYVSDVEEMRLHLGEERLNILGHSHGGVVALAYAARHPTRTRNVVAANALVRVQPEEMEEQMLRRLNEPWYDDARLALDQEEAGAYETEAELREITRRFWPMYFAHFDEHAERYLDAHVIPERPNPDALRLFNEGIETWDMRPELSQIVAPTLVLTGAADFICGPACAEDIAVGVGSAQKVVIEDCGHFSFVEDPDRFHHEVTRFMI